MSEVMMKAHEGQLMNPPNRRGTKEERELISQDRNVDLKAVIKMLQQRQEDKVINGIVSLMNSHKAPTYEEAVKEYLESRKKSASDINEEGKPYKNKLSENPQLKRVSTVIGDPDLKKKVQSRFKQVHDAKTVPQPPKKQVKQQTSPEQTELLRKLSAESKARIKFGDLYRWGPRDSVTKEILAGKDGEPLQGGQLKAFLEKIVEDAVARSGKAEEEFLSEKKLSPEMKEAYARVKDKELQNTLRRLREFATTKYNEIHPVKEETASVSMKAPKDKELKDSFDRDVAINNGTYARKLSRQQRVGAVRNMMTAAANYILGTQDGITPQEALDAVLNSKGWTSVELPDGTLVTQDDINGYAEMVSKMKQGNDPQAQRVWQDYYRNNTPEMIERRRHTRYRDYVDRAIKYLGAHRDDDGFRNFLEHNKIKTGSPDYDRLVRMYDDAKNFKVYDNPLDRVRRFNLYDLGLLKMPEQGYKTYMDQVTAETEALKKLTSDQIKVALDKLTPNASDDELGKQVSYYSGRAEDDKGLAGLKQVLQHMYELALLKEEKFDKLHELYPAPDWTQDKEKGRQYASPFVSPGYRYIEIPWMRYYGDVPPRLSYMPSQQDKNKFYWEYIWPIQRLTHTRDFDNLTDDNKAAAYNAIRQLGHGQKDTDITQYHVTTGKTPYPDQDSAHVALLYNLIRYADKDNRLADLKQKIAEKYPHLVRRRNKDGIKSTTYVADSQQNFFANWLQDVIDRAKSAGRQVAYVDKGRMITIPYDMIIQAATRDYDNNAPLVGSEGYDKKRAQSAKLMTSEDDKKQWQGAEGESTVHGTDDLSGEDASANSQVNLFGTYFKQKGGGAPRSENGSVPGVSVSGAGQHDKEIKAKKLKQKSDDDILPEDF